MRQIPPKLVQKDTGGITHEGGLAVVEAGLIEVESVQSGRQHLPDLSRSITTIRDHQTQTDPTHRLEGPPKKIAPNVNHTTTTQVVLRTFRNS